MENNLLKKYIYITESLCCIPETNTILQINYTSLKICVCVCVCVCIWELFNLHSIHSKGVFFLFFQGPVFCNWDCLELLVYDDNKKQTHFQTALLLFINPLLIVYTCSGHPTTPPLVPLSVDTVFRFLLCATNGATNFKYISSFNPHNTH